MRSLNSYAELRCLSDGIGIRNYRNVVVVSLKANVVCDHADRAMGYICINDVAALVAIDPDLVIALCICEDHDYCSFAVFLDCEVDYGAVLFLCCYRISDSCAEDSVFRVRYGTDAEASDKEKC